MRVVVFASSKLGDTRRVYRKAVFIHKFGTNRLGDEKSRYPSADFGLPLSEKSTSFREINFHWRNQPINVILNNYAKILLEY